MNLESMGCLSCWLHDFDFVSYKSVGRFNIMYFARKFQDKDYVSNYSFMSLTLFPMVMIIYELDSR